MSYFKDIDNYDDLKKKYHSLILKFHPSLYSFDKKIYCLGVCNEILEEFESLKRHFKEKELYDETDDIEYFRKFKRYNHNKAKFEFFDMLNNELEQLPIYRRYFKENSRGDYPDDDVVISDTNTQGGGFIIQSNSNINFHLYNTCTTELNLDMDDILKLYNLCDENAEKFKRVIIFLASGWLQPWDLRENLNSDNPIPIFDDSIIECDIPGYDSSLVLINEVTNHETISAWFRFCFKQCESFDKRFNEKLFEKNKVSIKN